MNPEIMDNVHKEDFMAFSQAVKQEITQRIANDPWIKKQAEELRKFQDIRDTYKKINQKEV